MANSRAKASITSDVEEKLAALSHEFKTPMAVTISALQLLQEKIEGNHPDEYTEQYQEFLNIATRNVYRTLRLTNNLIDSGRLNRGFTKPLMQNIDLTALLKEVVANISAYGQTRGTSITYDGTNHPVFVLCDAQMIDRVLLNLITNALKAVAPKGGVIKLSLEQKENETAITVTDNGCGIVSDDLFCVFEKYWCKTTKERADKSGIGLGLYIAQNLTALHGGKIQVESVENEGSTFTVHLPLQPLHDTQSNALCSTAAAYQSDWQSELLQIEMVDFT
ncbi:MAG: HAMP domain-containing sensor histidine kinase [Ruthenibacterium sp.]